ncbi:hypothetical protein [Pasteurella multocida]|uniref:hypothetical protein n=1 Tax=Pasteurella multocida TaxID=747 RepID=UPI000A8E0A80|nr:hypothetical protein [Pasteurella multocida]
MTKDEKRLAAIAKGLNVSPISNTAPSYQTATPTHYSSDVEYIGYPDYRVETGL